MLHDDELKQLAAQLAKPVGEHGIATGKQMQVHNANMIISSLQALQLSGNESVLEIGFGNAAHVPLVLQYGTGIRYTGVDISETMQSEALKNNAGAVEAGQVEFIITEGNSLPFAANSFDRLFTVNCIYFWKEASRYLLDFFKVLKSGAVGAIGYAERSFMQQLPFVQYGFTLYSKEEVEALLHVVGFVSVESIGHHEEVQASEKMIERPFVVTQFVKP